jgi:hypothetical protein
MKNFTNLLNTSFLLLLALSSQQLLAADDPKVEKRKTYSKSYNVSGNEKISLDNKFGEIKVSTWSKNEVKVDITIIASSATDERAQHLLDLISIEDGKSANGVFFKTNRKNDEKKAAEKNDYKNEKTETNYQVYLPAGNPLSVSNQFGATILPDINGELEVSSKFGAFTGGNLTNVKSLTVEFGTALVETIKGSDVTIKFSRAIINKLDGAVNAKFEHCSGIKLGIENSLKALTIKNNFTTLYLDVNKNLSADFNINTHFGELSNSTAFNINESSGNENKKGPRFTKVYSGKAGSGATDIKVKAEFSKIVIGHNLTMNLKEDKKTTTKI